MIIAKDYIETEVDGDVFETKVYFIRAERWQSGLVEALGYQNPSYFYRAEDLVALANPDFEYNTSGRIGNTAFIVTDGELSETEQKQLGQTLIDDHR